MENLYKKDKYGGWLNIFGSIDICVKGMMKRGYIITRKEKYP